MKFKLTETHYAHGELLDAGTEIGDGTPYPFWGLSMFMLPLDAEAEALLKKAPDKENLSGLPKEGMHAPKLGGPAKLTPASNVTLK
jgi:hypothetical protein